MGGLSALWWRGGGADAGQRTRERMRLRDGRCVVVRPVHADDERAEQSFVRGLSVHTRVLRFHVALRELAPPLLHALTHIDQRSHVAMVAEHDDGDAPAIVADARYVLQDDSRDAEFAIAVADDWQGVGLGHRLMQRLAAHAKRHGVRQLVGDVLRDNARMITMVRRTGGQIVRHPGDASLVRARFVL